VKKIDIFKIFIEITSMCQGTLITTATLFLNSETLSLHLEGIIWILMF